MKRLDIYLKDCAIDTVAIRRIVHRSVDFIKNKERLSLVTAIDEIVSNIIRHGFVNRYGTLRILIYSWKKKIRIVIEDDGRPFDPTTFKTKSYDELIQGETEGKIGLRLVMRVMDRLEYHRRKGRNQLIMEKLI